MVVITASKHMCTVFLTRFFFYLLETEDFALWPSVVEEYEDGP